ncbi:MAG: 1-deoxy-D-xylulose 5-phosphate reductoisomerase [Spartobacteria bacterium]|nr:1-deoxy-D-xylulose 5-phosphate reductoisomerase [Spartobacteria bacterium]
MLRESLPHVGGVRSPMRRKRVVVLGATGSIGQSALKVAHDIPERMEIVGLAAHSQAEKLAQAANRVRAQAVCLVDESKIEILHRTLDYKPRVYSGAAGLREIAGMAEADMVLIAIVGTGGLSPALAAIKAGKDLAVASKEILVMAGEIVMREASARGVHVLPVDSEHNAIFQCLEGKRSTLNVQPPTPNAESSALSIERSAFDVSDVRRIILTASGGPFRETPAKDFDSITVERALKHPTWNMGPKITIDSATLFNKGLEMIEAHWLFGVEMKRVEVVVHPQSIVHSMVEFSDGSVLAQLSHSDMCFPIQYAVTWPERVPNSLPPLEFGKLAKLEFFEPRYQDFPALNLARQAGEIGGTMPAVLNAGNEIAVAAFLRQSLGFAGIWRVVEQVMNCHANVAHPDLDAILQADQWARAEATAAIGTHH